MAFYLGGNKFKIIVDNKAYLLNIPDVVNILSGIKLLTLDNYALKDSNGLYLTAKEAN